MKPATYKATESSKSHRPVVTRFDAYYPKGRVAAILRKGMDAEFWIARQVEEDKATRLRHITDYLAERAARPAPVAAPTNQLDLF